MRTLRIFIPLLLALGVFCGCRTAKGGDASGRPQVVATTGMVADLARRVGGDTISVRALMGPGVDPHLYKASPGDVQALSDADLVLYNGLHLEGKMAEVLEQVGRNKPVVAVADVIEESLKLESINYPGNYDPHAWFDVALWSEAIPVVVEALSELIPEMAQEFEQRGEEYQQELLGLDEEVREQLSQVPRERRVMVTAHDAFRYFGRAYDIEVLGIQGLSTDSEAGLSEINELVDILVRRNIPAVFVETSVNPRNVEALVEGARQRGHNVVIGGSLFSDAMGADGTPEGEYPGMIRHNVSQIVEALK